MEMSRVGRSQESLNFLAIYLFNPTSMRTDNMRPVTAKLPIPIDTISLASYSHLYGASSSHVQPRALSTNAVWSKKL